MLSPITQYDRKYRRLEIEFEGCRRRGQRAHRLLHGKFRPRRYPYRRFDVIAPAVTLADKEIRCFAARRLRSSPSWA
ncbi:MAG: hypothetical protein ACLRSW_01365 [Christensenellaceae bacterium]